MALTERIKTDLKEAMKARDARRTGTLRMILADLQKTEADKRRELREEEEIAILQRGLKQRREAAEAFAKGARPAQAEAERLEGEIIAAYMPAQLGDDELAAAVAELVAETGAAAPGDLGRVMGPLMKRFAGRLDGDRARTAVQVALSS